MQNPNALPATIANRVIFVFSFAKWDVTIYICQSNKQLRSLADKGSIDRKVKDIARQNDGLAQMRFLTPLRISGRRCECRPTAIL